MQADQQVDYSQLFANINSLPRDVLVLLFSFIREHRDLVAVSLCSRKCRDIIAQADLLPYALNPPVRKFMDRSGLSDDIRHRLSARRLDTGDAGASSGTRGGATHVLVATEGADGSGKTSLETRFCCNHFVEEYDPCIGENGRKQLVVDEEVCLLEVVEVPGAPEFDVFRADWRRRVQVHLLVYDITARDTLQRASQLMRTLRAERGPELPLLLVGNKVDLCARRQVQRREAEALAHDCGAAFIETSCKTGQNVALLFQEAVRLARAASLTQEQLKAAALAQKGRLACCLQ